MAAIAAPVNRLRSATLEGMTAHPVSLEASFTRGLPGFSIVGLGDETIRESKERIKSALQLSGFSFPPLKITVSLFPGDLKKSGSQMDLPIALLIALHKQPLSLKEGFFCFGELGLDGSVRTTPAIFSLALFLARDGHLKQVLCDRQSAERIAAIPGVCAYGVETLKEALAFLQGEQPLKPAQARSLGAQELKIADRSYYYEASPEKAVDFNQVRGQQQAKRAALIAAAGFHNLILSGAPGCGKSMIIKRLSTILPPMDLQELLTQASLEALEQGRVAFSARRPFRAPHHSATRASIFGGGSKNARMGEVALSHGGVLFFDEVVHFAKSTLEALREPLEDHQLLISRVNTKVRYETRFLFAAAMNPCPCGNLYSGVQECRCTPIEISRYQNRLSDPFWDRIDLTVQMADSDPKAAAQESSAAMREQVFCAFRQQKQRGQTQLNGKLGEQEAAQFCLLEEEASVLLDQAASRFGLSMRAVERIRRVARTIADLEASDTIEKPHLLEALSFRRR